MSSNTCANCGKEGHDSDMNTCNKCKMAKYCNAACKKKHRKKHKKQCERRVAELDEKALFKQPPPVDDCPICFLRMPCLTSAQVYMSCCGKLICRGCNHAPLYDNRGNKVNNEKCAFCRTPNPTSEREMIERYEKRMKLNDATAFYNIGGFYSEGLYGYPQNYAKASELYHRAAELGCVESHNNIGYAYFNGEGVGRDEKKAKHYYELAAMRGEAEARHNLGVMEKMEGKLDRALKHWMIAVKCGFNISLKGIKELYMEGHATKDDYTNALQSYQSYLDDIKSNQRDEAATFKADWKYY